LRPRDDDRDEHGMNESIETFERLLAAVADRPAARLRIARRMLAAGHGARAREIAAEASEAAPGSPEVQMLARTVASRGVPIWHFGLVRDTVRNDAYEAGLRQVVTPKSRVLEIGTGTGILAMMAARAGAAEVTTCEMNPAVADAAREIIARNGYADRVRVVGKRAEELVVGDDLSSRADVLVSEIFACNVFAEHGIPAIETAQRDLLTPDAVVIPQLITVRIALADGKGPRHMGQVSGFDLSPFNRLHEPSSAVDVGSTDLVLRSDPQDLFRLDFRRGRYPLADRARTTVWSRGGRATGVVQWLRLEMVQRPDAAVYENQPSPGRRSAWGAVFHPFEAAVDTSPGDAFEVTGTHDGSSTTIWAEPVTREP
jgi:protein arginine N-methyltransferase 7